MEGRGHIEQSVALAVFVKELQLRPVLVILVHAVRLMQKLDRFSTVRGINSITNCRSVDPSREGRRFSQTRKCVGKIRRGGPREGKETDDCALSAAEKPG